eukprot:759309-Hanusia_phi.AAC.1
MRIQQGSEATMTPQKAPAPTLSNDAESGRTGPHAGFSDDVAGQSAILCDFNVGCFGKARSSAT